MKNILKRTIALALACLMLVGLAACGGDTQPDSTQPSASDDPNVKNLQGRRIRIALWWDEFWDSNYKTLDQVEAAAGSIEDTEVMQMKLDKIREIERKWNCEIEWVNMGWSGIQESLNTAVVAGTPECDIYLCASAWALSIITNGYAQKFTDYAPADSDILTDNNIFQTYAPLGYEGYLFNSASIYPGGATYLAYNKTILDSLGLEDPNVLAERGEWTYEKFAEYLNKCVQDTNTDGTPDVYGYGSASIDTIRGFLASNNVELAGSAKEGLSSEASIEAWNFIDRIYNIDKSARPYQSNWEDDRDAIYKGKVVFSFVHQTTLAGAASRVDHQIYICPSPTGSFGDGTMSAPRASDMYFIPTGVEDPTSVYCIFEEMNNWYNGDFSYRDNPSYWEGMFQTQEQLDLAIELGFKDNSTDIWESIDTRGAVNDVFNQVVINRAMTVAQAIESNKQILQSEIDAFLNPEE